MSINWSGSYIQQSVVSSDAIDDSVFTFNDILFSFGIVHVIVVIQSSCVMNVASGLDRSWCIEAQAVVHWIFPSIIFCGYLCPPFQVIPMFYWDSMQVMLSFDRRVKRPKQYSSTDNLISVIISWKINGVYSIPNFYDGFCRQYFFNDDFGCCMIWKLKL